MAFAENHMIVDPALQAEIVARCLAQRIGDQPDLAVHDLGDITLPDGRRTAVYLRHAADAIILDEHRQMVLITRIHDPGAGKLAIPGGFIDEVDGAVETVLETAIREAVEETGIDGALLRGVTAAPVGPRRFARPFDIRLAWSDIAGTVIRKGEIFTVSTQPYRFRLAGDLRDVALQAGDDAGAVQVLRIAGLDPARFAVPDHPEMIEAAIA
jgi:8-oxo-dGTP pyrophosphatase MutT (NUDIX family)